MCIHYINRPTNNIIMSDKSNNEPSTIGSYVDSAIGAAQKFVGDLTGNTADSVRFTLCMI